MRILKCVGVLLAFMATLAACGTPSSQPFDSSKWEAAGRDCGGESTVRRSMVADLERQHLLRRGMTLAQVRHLLGQADEQWFDAGIPSRPNAYSYGLGRRGSDCLSSLLIRFRRGKLTVVVYPPLT